MHDNSIVLLVKGWLPNMNCGVSLLRLDVEKGNVENDANWKVNLR